MQVNKVSKLYIFPRTDIASMNPGKMAAQVSHAATQFLWAYGGNPLVDEWMRQSDGAGTTIVLDGGSMPEKIEPLVAWAKEKGFMSGVYEDPEYPLMDGNVLHLFPLKTCGWIFFPAMEHDGIIMEKIKSFDLHG